MKYPLRPHTWHDIRIIDGNGMTVATCVSCPQRDELMRRANAFDELLAFVETYMNAGHDSQAAQLYRKYAERSTEDAAPPNGYDKPNWTPT